MSSKKKFITFFPPFLSSMVCLDTRFHRLNGFKCRFSALFCIQPAGFEGCKFTATISVLTASIPSSPKVQNDQKFDLAHKKNWRALEKEWEWATEKRTYIRISSQKKKYFAKLYKAMHIRCVLLIFKSSVSCARSRSRPHYHKRHRIAILIMEFVKSNANG